MITPEMGSELPGQRATFRELRVSNSLLRPFGLLAILGLLSLYWLAASGTRLGDTSTISLFVIIILIGGFVDGWVTYSYVLAKCRINPIYNVDWRYWLLTGAVLFIGNLPWIVYRTITGVSGISPVASFLLIAICFAPAHMLALLLLQIKRKRELWMRLGADFARRKQIIAYFVKSNSI